MRWKVDTVRTSRKSKKKRRSGAELIETSTQVLLGVYNMAEEAPTAQPA